MTTAETTPTHRNAAERHLERRDQLLREARRFDFRTLHLEHNRVARNALIEQAEQAHGDYLATVGEFSEEAI